MLLYGYSVQSGNLPKSEAKVLEENENQAGLNVLLFLIGFTDLNLCAF
jgi:hypothetical protein